MGNGDRPNTDPYPKGRQISSFADFKKKISLIPMEDEVRKIILDRVNKYPEASLDYVWKRLQDFVSAASRQRIAKNKKSSQPEVQEILPVVEKVNLEDWRDH